MLALKANSQPEMQKVEWLPFFDQYKGSGGIIHKGKIYDSHIIGFGERLDVYDLKSGRKIQDTTLAHIKLADFKKPKHMDFFGYFKEEDDVFLLTRCSSHNGQKSLYIIPLDGSSNILKSEDAEQADEGFDLDAIYGRDAREVRSDRYIALREARYLGDDEYSGIETSLLVLDVINDKLVWEVHVEKGSEYAKFWNERFFISHTYAAFSYEGSMKMKDCEYGDRMEVNLKTHLKTDLMPRLIAFKKTEAGFIAVIDESKKSDAFTGSDKFSGVIHRLIINEDLEILEEKTVSWNLLENDLGIEKVSREVYINENGDVFIMSNNNMVYGMDIFGISAEGKKWVKSIPFNHGNSRMYHAHNIDGTGIQLKLFDNKLYIAYGDNRKNPESVDYQNYRRPKKELDTHFWNEAENKIITVLRLDADGNVELFKVVDETDSKIHLTNMDIEEGIIHLHGAKGLRNKTALLKF